MSAATVRTTGAAALGDHGFTGDVVSVLVKVGIGAVLVLLDRFVATARPSGRT